MFNWLLAISKVKAPARPGGARNRKTEEAVDRHQNNRSVRAVFPRHCVATWLVSVPHGSCCLNCCAEQSHKDNVCSTVVAEKRPKQKKYNFRSPAPPPAAQSYRRGLVICRWGSLEGPAPPQSLLLISPRSWESRQLTSLHLWLDLAWTLLVGGQWLSFLFMGREWRGSPSG